MGFEAQVAEARRLANEGRYDDAVQIWRDVCALGPPNARHRVEMARCLVELGSEDAAVFELQTALALDCRVLEVIEDEHRFSSIVGRVR